MTVKDELYRKIKVLNETVWENRADKKRIEKWLDNFEGEEEKLHALFLLSKFVYFGSVQMRDLLKSVYRDLFKYRIVKEIRENNGDTTDLKIINEQFDHKLSKTKFLGVGNPSESGVHLLYFFRQENKLAKSQFIDSHEIFNRSDPSNVKLMDPTIREYIFIDDFCGTGSQAIEYSNHIIEEILSIDPTIRTSYLMLFATKEGKSNVIKNTKFQYVDAVYEFDDTFQCFSPKSRFFKKTPTGIDSAIAKAMCEKHGKKLIKSIIRMENRGIPEHKLDDIAENHKLGFGDCQLLMGFHHNTPDNTLPIIWYDENEIPWNPIFKRYNKKYGN